MGKNKRTEKLLESLSELAHNEWMEWSQTINDTEEISAERISRWRKLWVPYNKLSEDNKDQDRAYARRMIKIFKENEMNLLTKVKELFMGKNKDKKKEKKVSKPSQPKPKK